MWIMIVMSSFFIEGSSGRSIASPSITAIEFSSRERCITAADFTKKQAKIYNAFCVQK